MYNTIKKNIEFLITEIKTLQSSVELVTKITLNVETIAKELKVPKRHIDFLFKYYCNYSVNDFSNLVKVKYALLLISG